MFIEFAEKQISEILKSTPSEACGYNIFEIAEKCHCIGNGIENGLKRYVWTASFKNHLPRLVVTTSGDMVIAK